MALPEALKDRLDAGESAFVERALLHIESETYDTEFPPLEGRKYVPVDSSSPPGAKFTVYRQYTRTGMARMITEEGLDLPTTGLFVKEFSHQFYRLGTSYKTTLDDILAAQLAAVNGQPLNLDMELALAARRNIEQWLDSLAATGTDDSTMFPDIGLVGLANLPNATVYTIPNGAAGTPDWASKTPDEVLADLTGIVADQIASTFKVEQPDTILLPIAQMEDIAGRSMGDGRSDTILSYFLKTNRYIKTVDSWALLAGAGDTSTDRMVCYKMDKRKVRHMIAEEFRQMPPTYKGLTFTTECTAKSAGVISPYPLSVSYGDGI